MANFNHTIENNEMIITIDKAEKEPSLLIKEILDFFCSEKNKSNIKVLKIKANQNDISYKQILSALFDNKFEFSTYNDNLKYAVYGYTAA